MNGEVMKINKECHKRASTWLNLITLITAAIMAYFPTIGLDQVTTGVVMMTCAIITAICQAFTFKKDAENVHDSES